MMKISIMVLMATLLVGCVQSGYKHFYKPCVDATTIPELQLLENDQEPQLIRTNNFDRDVLVLQSKNYIPIGYSSFNGGYEDIKNAAAQAKRIKATIVLVSSRYTNTQTTTSTLLLPDNQVTYHSGDANATTIYNNSGGLGSSNTYSTYSGTSTTYGTKAVPITSQQRRYDQYAVYLVRSTKKCKFGINYNDLTPMQRSKFERNTGVFVNFVIEDTPAFYANILAGDVLVNIDGKAVKNARHAWTLMENASWNNGTSELTIIRNGLEKTIEVKSSSQ
jgi:hypothetical protein